MLSLELEVFYFNSLAVRSVFINGSKWLVLSDVLKAVRSIFSLRESTTYINGLLKHALVICNIESRNETCVSEAGLVLFLKFKQKDETALSFFDWYYSEVYPPPSSSTQYLTSSKLSSLSVALDIYSKVADMAGLTGVDKLISVINAINNGYGVNLVKDLGLKDLVGTGQLDKGVEIYVNSRGQSITKAQK